MSTRATLRASAVALVVAALCPAAGATAAQPERPSLRLVSQTPWVARGAEFQLGMVIDDAGRDDLELTVGVHRVITSRTDFARTLEGTVRGSAFTTRPAGLDELESVGGVRFVRFPLQDPALPRDPGNLLLRDDGVYPVRVELAERGGGDVLDSFVTHLVHVTDPVEAPRLSVAWVVPVHAPPALQPDGERRLDPASAGSLATLATQLESRPDLAVSIAPTPETLDALASVDRQDETEILARLAAVAQRSTTQVLAGPYAPLSLPAVAGTLQPEFTEQLTTGADVLASTIEARADPSTWVVEGALTEAALSRLRSRQVDRVVVPEGVLAPVDLQLTLAQPFTLGGRESRRLTAAMADAGLARHFRATDQPVLAAHHLLADLAVIWFDSPAHERGVVAAAPRRWRPTAPFLEALLDGLTRSPVLEPATLDQLFDEVPLATAERRLPLTRSLAAPSSPGPSLPVEAIEATRARLEAFGGILNPGEPVFDRMERTLLVAESADLRASDRRRYLQGVADQITGELEQIEGPEHREITLTARRGSVPVTVRKTLPYPVTVVVRVASDQLRIEGGTVRRLELTRPNTTELFTVEARTSGAFPLRVSLESPDGRLVLATGRFTVRSTAASGVGVILSVGAGWVLLVWWVRHGMRRRRRTAN